MHTFNSLYSVSITDAHLILAESRKYQKELEHFQSLLSLDQVYNITWIRIIDDDKFQTITQIPEELLLQYFHSGLWKTDKLATPYLNESHWVIDYSYLNPHSTFSKNTEGLLSLFYTNHFQNIYDHFSFDIDKSFYHAMNDRDKELLNGRVKNIINLIYQTISLRITFKVLEHKAIFFETPNENKQVVLEKFKLTSLNLDYLKLIATGNTAKEIAYQFNKSYRSVEATIKILSKKLQCHNKQELIIIARIITSYLN